MDDDERHELAHMLNSALSHLFRYEDGSAKDAQGEIAAARLLIERVHDRLRDPD
jgi:hypothetical protein